MDQPVTKHTTETAEDREMPTESNPADSHRLVRLAEKMHDKEYRDGYVAAHTRQVLAKQVRELRGEKSQTEFADMLGKRQTMVSRLENPSYSGWTLNTLFEVASKLNVAVFVRFVDFPTFLKYSGRQSEADLHPSSYDEKQVDEFARAQAELESPQERGILIADPASIFHAVANMPTFQLFSSAAFNAASLNDYFVDIYADACLATPKPPYAKSATPAPASAKTYFIPIGQQAASTQQP